MEHWKQGKNVSVMLVKSSLKKILSEIHISWNQSLFLFCAGRLKGLFRKDTIQPEVQENLLSELSQLSLNNILKIIT